MSEHIFADCQSAFPNATTTELLQCVSDNIEKEQNDRAVDLQHFLFVIAGAMIFLMQSGFAMVCAGAVRLKNVQNSMMKNLLDACGAAISFYIIGYAFAFGSQDDSKTTFIGVRDFASVAGDPAFWFFEYTFSATSVTIVAGTLAERCQMIAYLLYSMVLAGFIYPVVAHSAWSPYGFLSPDNEKPLLGSGTIDFAGSGVVHLTGGLVALYATVILGARKGRFYDEAGEPLETPKPMHGHSIALQLLGTMVLWFGWFGFNPGSALLLVGNDHVGLIAAHAAVSTALSGAAGGISALFTNLIIEERRTGEPAFSLVMAMNGSLAGLVAVTSGCALMEPWAAIVTGIIGGWLYMFSSHLLIKYRVDDAVDAIPVHMTNGIWGMIATGFFASPSKMELTYGNSEHVGWFYSWGRGSSDASLLACQIICCLFIIGWTMFTMFPFFIWLNYRGWLRSDSLEELVGLDISYHGNDNEFNTEVKKEFVDAYKRHKGRTTEDASNGRWYSSRDQNDDPHAPIRE